MSHLKAQHEGKNHLEERFVFRWNKNGVGCLKWAAIGGQKVWPLTPERYLLTNMEVVVLLLWGCFAASGNGDLREVSGIMKKEARLQIVQEKLKSADKRSWMIFLNLVMSFASEQWSYTRQKWWRTVVSGHNEHFGMISTKFWLNPVKKQVKTPESEMAILTSRKTIVDSRIKFHGYVLWQSPMCCHGNAGQPGYACTHSVNGNLPCRHFLLLVRVVPESQNQDCPVQKRIIFYSTLKAFSNSYNMF